jgi:hypothetical protein
MIVFVVIYISKFDSYKFPNSKKEGFDYKYICIFGRFENPRISKSPI